MNRGFNGRRMGAIRRPMPRTRGSYATLMVPNRCGSRVQSQWPRELYRLTAAAGSSKRSGLSIASRAGARGGRNAMDPFDFAAHALRWLSHRSASMLRPRRWRMSSTQSSVVNQEGSRSCGAPQLLSQPMSGVRGGTDRPSAAARAAANWSSVHDAGKGGHPRGSRGPASQAPGERHRLAKFA